MIDGDADPLEAKRPSVVPDAERDALVKADTQDTRSKKGIVGSNPRGDHYRFTHFPKDPICELCKMITQ